MLLPFTSDLLITSPYDPEMAALADRHYSRKTIGARQFMGNGRKIVIRNTSGSIVFGWMWPDAEKRLDRLEGFQCTIFRNESDRISSQIILECERIIVSVWGSNQAYTYVDPGKIYSVNPGYCFKKAGWKTIRNQDGSVRKSRAGAHLLGKDLA
jgi:hypothetical protein